MTIRKHTSLTHIEIKTAKPKNKIYRLFDGNGLCLKILTSGKKIWEYRFKNPETKKEDTLVLGDFPTISLSEARSIHQTHRLEVLKGINPKRNNDSLAFPIIFESWWKIWSQTKSDKYAKQVYNAINSNCMKALSHLNIDEIEVPHIIEALQPFEKRGATEYLHRTRSGLNQLFSFAISRGLCKFNPVMMIGKNSFKTHIPKNHKSLDPKKIYKVFEFLESNNYSLITQLCTEFILRTMTRAQESCKATWSEFDLTNNLWVIPAERMKMNREHIIPLTHHHLSILDQMKRLNPKSRYVFPSICLTSHICLETPRMAIQRFGIDSTIHGFRHLASTLLNESGLFDIHIIEASLAHQDKNSIRATYNKAKYLKERKELLDWWNSTLDQCQSIEENKQTIDRLIAINY